uniref:Plectin/eS10 N-terminal domain-containing protein n=1 Tax=Anopheles epiroticus TaxID=199890 RepID=A0A182PN88_9DIPT
MFMPKEHRIAIYTALFKDGVMTALKDERPVMHRELKTIPNLHVIKTLNSLVSKNYAKESFVWRIYYWTLTNEGISYLRNCLYLRSEIVPSTLIHQRPHVRNIATSPATGPISRATDEDREAYRRLRADHGDKRGYAGAGTGEMQFRGGFGRGKRAE